jgi:hypothetical protein
MPPSVWLTSVLFAVVCPVYSSRVRRHACAVILLGGWLIMLPPSKTSVVDGQVTTKVDTDAPIDQWTQESAYDTARGCQAGVAGFAKMVTADAMLPVFAAARCVPTEAVYPPKKPAQK